MINLLLASRTWTVPRNAEGVRHHVLALYQQVFQGHPTAIYPRQRESGVLRDGLRHVWPAIHGQASVLCPGYPVVAGALASLWPRHPGLVVHTWKVPGHTDARMSARLYDAVLLRALRSARAVVVASQMQQRQLQALGLASPVLFSPVTVDSTYWQPEPPDKEAVLTALGLSDRRYVLTVGGNDRDEVYAARVAQALGLTYLRASTHAPTLQAAQAELEALGLAAHARMLLAPKDHELRVLYGAARLVCLPTRIATNPAGLTALVESLACGALVAVPPGIAPGYVDDGRNGLLLPEQAADLVRRLQSGLDEPRLRTAARHTACTVLDARSEGQRLRGPLLAALGLDHP